MRSAILIAAALLLCPAPALAERPADVARAPGVETWPADDGLWVRRHLRVTLGVDGRIVTEVEQALKPYTDHPMREDLLDPRIDWNDARRSLEVLETVTWMVDGTEVRALDNSLVPNTAGALEWAVPYASMRQLTVSHVGVEHGSTSLLRYRVADRADLGVPMWGQQTLADAMPIQSQRVILEVPAGSPLQWGVLHGVAQPERSSHDGLDRYVFQDLTVPGMNTAENHGYGVPTLLWSSSPSWAHTRGFLEAQVEPAALADGYVRAKLEAVLDGSLTPAERVARIHTFVVEGVRSIDWPPADFGYAARSAPEVLTTSVGHALDKAVLEVAMLRAAGFEAHVALAAPHGWLPGVPSPVPFDQVWVRVDAGHHPVWLDPTASQEAHNGVHLAGKAVLVLDGASTEPQVMRALDPDHNHATLRARLDLSAAEDGLGVAGRADLDLAGLYCPVVGFDRDKDRTSGVAGGLAGLFGGGEHSAVVAQQSPGFLALGADFEGGSLEPGANGMLRLELPRVPGAVSGADLQAYRQQRTLPLELSGPARELVEFTLTLPSGWEAATLPSPVELDSPVGRYARTVSVEDATVTLRSELELKQAVVAPEDWPLLRALLLEADNPARRALLLRPVED